MSPTEFPEQTVVFAKNQPEYRPLPAHVDVTSSQIVIRRICAQFNRQRLRVKRDRYKRVLPAVRRSANACNCGDPACRGLTCDSIRHGTASDG